MIPARLLPMLRRVFDGLFPAGEGAAANIVEGFEFTLPPNRMHFTMQENNQQQFTLPPNRMHFTLADQD